MSTLGDGFWLFTRGFRPIKVAHFQRAERTVKARKASGAVLVFIRNGVVNSVWDWKIPNGATCHKNGRMYPNRPLWIERTK